jgi:hypothetical protein
MPPPLPVGEAAALGIALAAVAAGVALLLWGRLAGRIAFLAAGGGVGWWLGAILAAKMNVSPLPAQILTAVAAGMLALLLTPLLWAVLAGALAGGAALYFAVLHYLPMLSKGPPSLNLAGLDFRRYAGALADHAWRCTKDVWEGNAAAIGIIVGLAGGVPLLIGAIRMRLATVVMSSLTGGAAILTGLAVAAGVLFPAVAPVLWDHWFILAGAAAATAVVGIGVQYRRILKADKDQKNREGEPPKDKPVLD